MKLLKKTVLISASVAFVLFSMYVLYAFVVAQQIRDKTLTEIAENHRADNPLPNICESVLRRDIEDCRKFLLRGDDPEQRCTVIISRIDETIRLEQVSPLMISAQQNDTIMFDLLCQFGANLRCKDFYNRDLLMVASWFASKEIIHKLLVSEANLNWLGNKDFSGNNALFYAQLSGNTEVISILREYGFSEDSSSDNSP